MLTYRFYAVGLAVLMTVLLVSSCGHEGSDGGGERPFMFGPKGTGVGGQGSGPTPVDLGTADDYVILAKSGISNVPTSTVTGNLGLSPATSTAFTQWSETMDGSGTFSTSAQVNGQLFASDYAAPTPDNLTTAILDMEAAYTDAAGRPANVTELGGGNIGGLTLKPGVYKWSTGVTIPTDLTLSGGANDTWIFQISQSLTMASATDIILSGGALPQNIFWQVFGVATIGTTSSFQGILMSQTSIVMLTGASANGKLFAQTAVTLDSNVVAP